VRQYAKVAVFTLLISSLNFISAPSAFASPVYSFTNAGATGRNGPTQAQVNSAYTATTLAGAVTISGSGVQLWTVPTTGNYRIQAIGAGGGGTKGGNGASMTGEFSLTSGAVLKVVVGQTGVGVSDGNSRSGGGGGSYVATNANSPLIVGGGGGGAALTGTGWNPSFGGDGSTNPSPGLTSGGSSGTGESGCGGKGQGGAGFNSNGSGSVTTNANGVAVSPAQAFVNGSIGGTGGSDQCSNTIGGMAFGGFGGGGGGGNGGGGGGGYFGGTGGDNQAPTGQYDSGDGGGSFNSGSNQTNQVASNRNQNGSVTITSLGPSVSSFAPTTTLTNSSSLTYNLVFTQSVTGLAGNDFSVSGTGSSTCTIGTPSGSGTTYSVSLSGCSPGTVILTLASNAITNSSSQTGPSSNTAASTVTIDQTAPTISSVSAPANKTYIPTETPTFTVAFSESVTVTGTPRLVLTVGSLTEYADYVSMSDSRTARFRYTVALDANEFDTDGIALSTTLDANGGSIADLASNALTNFGLSAPTLTSVLVAQPPGAPTITSITPASGQLSVAFTAGATRGSAITSYQYSTDNGSTWKARASGTDGSPVVISTVSASASSLANGTSYNVRLRAVNAAGNSDSSTAVAATPSAITVSGDSTLTTTYGTAASSGTYSATGGTGPYTFTLSSSATGVSISSGVVSVSSTAPAGTYVRNVVATDNASQTGSRQLTITINKASTSISISLPNSATDAALGGAITITATVSQAGSVNFRLGGTTISGCGSVSSSAGSATCSWTPGSLGSATLSAVLTPTDSGNYDGATSTNLSITVVNGVTTVSMSLAGGVTQAPKGQNIVITATVDQAGRISFFADGKRISGCFNRAVSGSSTTCTWKPAIQKQVNLTSRLVPTNSAYSTATATLQVTVVRRTGTR